MGSEDTRDWPDACELVREGAAEADDRTWRLLFCRRGSEAERPLPDRAFFGQHLVRSSMAASCKNTGRSIEACARRT